MVRRKGVIPPIRAGDLQIALGNRQQGIAAPFRDGANIRLETGTGIESDDGRALCIDQFQDFEHIAADWTAGDQDAFGIGFGRKELLLFSGRQFPVTASDN